MDRAGDGDDFEAGELGGFGGGAGEAVDEVGGAEEGGGEGGADVAAVREGVQRCLYMEMLGKRQDGILVCAGGKKWDSTHVAPRTSTRGISIPQYQNTHYSLNRSNPITEAFLPQTNHAAGQRTPSRVSIPTYLYPTDPNQSRLKYAISITANTPSPSPAPVSTNTVRMG